MPWDSLPEKPGTRNVPGWGAVAPLKVNPSQQGWNVFVPSKFPLTVDYTGSGDLAVARQINLKKAVTLTGAGTLTVARRWNLKLAPQYTASGNLVITPSFPVFAPVTTVYSTVGTFTYTLPLWATKFDVIILGGGGGGVGGGSTFIAGKGGTSGQWNGVANVARTGNTISVTVGDGGAGGPSGQVTGGNSSPGAASSAAGYSAAGGSGGSGPGNSTGVAPGNYVINGITYSGGVGGSQGNPGTAGTIGAGGGGGDGGLATGRAGGKGGAGRVWIRAIQ